MFLFLEIAFIGNQSLGKCVFGMLLIRETACLGSYYLDYCAWKLVICFFGKLLLAKLPCGLLLQGKLSILEVVIWKVTSWRTVKELSLCHKLKFLIPIFTTECTKPLIFQIYRLIYLTEFSFYPMSTTLDCKHLRKDNQTLWQRLL